jgi:hypothetical protein
MTITSPSPEHVINQWTWKTPAMKRMTIAVCRLALERGLSGEFSALDLQSHGADEHGGTGIAGSVFRQLADAGILAAVGGYLGSEFVQRRVRNAGGNMIGLWRLSNPGLARALLTRHGRPLPKPEQIDLFKFPKEYA